MISMTADTLFFTAVLRTNCWRWLKWGPFRIRGQQTCAVNIISDGWVDIFISMTHRSRSAGRMGINATTSCRLFTEYEASMHPHPSMSCQWHKARCFGEIGKRRGGDGGCLLFLTPPNPPNPPASSLCPPDGCPVECSVTRLFLDGSAWNTQTRASLKINTRLLSRRVARITRAGLQPEFVSEFFCCRDGPVLVFSRFFLLNTTTTNKYIYIPSSASSPSSTDRLPLIALPNLKVPKALEMSPEDCGAGLRYDSTWRTN